jgi:hypothetical protein
MLNKEIDFLYNTNKFLPFLFIDQDQILRLNQSIIDGFNRNHKTGAVFFDLEKAFDKTPHEYFTQNENE